MVILSKTYFNYLYACTIHVFKVLCTVCDTLHVHALIWTCLEPSSHMLVYYLILIIFYIFVVASYCVSSKHHHLYLAPVAREAFIQRS